jgi:hypothetical protein
MSEVEPPDHHRRGDGGPVGTDANGGMGVEGRKLANGSAVVSAIALHTSSLLFLPVAWVMLSRRQR